MFWVLGKLIRVFRWALATASLVAGLAGLLLQATVRDSDPQYAPIFYALPMPVATGLLVVAAVLSKRRWIRKATGLIALIALGIWFYQSCGWAYPTSGKWKAMVWNMGRPMHPFEPLIAFVKAERPDLVALVESGGISKGDVLTYERALPGYRMVAGPHGLACLVHGEVREVSDTTMANDTKVVQFRAKIRGQQMTFFTVDLGADPRIPREPQLASLAKLMSNRTRTLILGDFNTPLESVFLNGLRAHASTALEGPHRGFRETWFYGVPLLSLDQIWLSRDLEPKFATRRFTLASDHAPVVATFSPGG